MFNVHVFQMFAYMEHLACSLIRLHMYLFCVHQEGLVYVGNGGRLCVSFSKNDTICINGSG